MSETVNIAEVANKLSNDIFKYFLWKAHPKRDENFSCSNTKHASEKGKPKLTHPADVIFYYEDPYVIAPF